MEQLFKYTSHLMGSVFFFVCLLIFAMLAAFKICLPHLAFIMKLIFILALVSDFFLVEEEVWNLSFYIY